MFWSKSKKDNQSDDNQRSGNEGTNRLKSDDEVKQGFFNKLFQKGCDSDFVYYEE